MREDRDNLDGLLRAARTVDAGDGRAWVDAMLELAGDDDPFVATSAVATLIELKPYVVAGDLRGLIRPDSPLRGVVPRSKAVDAPELRAALVMLLAEVVRPGDAELSLVVPELSDGRIRSQLLAALARSSGEALIANAARWANTSDTGALLHLPSERLRVQFARALAPWPGAAIDLVRRSWLAQKWPSEERERITRAMEGRANEESISDELPLP